MPTKHKDSSSAPSPVPILGICGHKQSGKTKLIIELLEHLNERGLRVAIIKHESEKFHIESPKHESFEFRHAGAQQVLVTSEQRWALLYERECAKQPSIEEHIADLQTDDLDLVLIEGNIGNTFPKLEVHRPIMCKPLLFPEDPQIKAIATDSPLILSDDLILLDILNIKTVADFIIEEIVGNFKN